ncbi:MAG: hypothetical protein M3362_04755, partial [Acidobacteriota bacterium]|nr:hypothetical protein [Acidobacteriota bacterium]
MRVIGSAHSFANSFTYVHVRAAKLLRRAANASLLLIAMCVVAWPVAALATGDIQYTNGNADSFLRSDYNVDPSTLGMTLRIPLGNYPGRGDASMPITLYYSSKLWRMNFVNTGNQQVGAYGTELEPLYAEHSVNGWTSTMDVPVVDTSMWYDQYNLNGQPAICSSVVGTACYHVKRVIIRMPDGSSHELRQNNPVFNCPKGSSCETNYLNNFVGTYYAADGSRLRYDTTTSTLYLADGSRYVIGNPTTQYIDRNGNTLSYNSNTRQWTDTLGRTLNVPLPNNLAAGTFNYTLPGVGGTTLTYQLVWKNLADVLTDPSQPLRYEGDCNDPELPGTLSPSLFHSSDSWWTSVCGGAVFNPVLLNQIILPTGQSYTFTYNVYGEIDKVVLPTGGYERYNYSSIQSTAWMREAYEQGNRGVIDRWESADGVSEVHWQYAAGYADVNHTQPYTTTITAPDGTYSKRTLYAATASQSKPAWGFDNILVGIAYEERAYSASGQMLLRTLTDWAGTSGNEAWPISDPKVTQQVSIVLDTGGNALASTETYDYDGDLNRTSTTEYDYATVDQTTAQTGTSSQIPLGARLRIQEATFLVNDTVINSTTRTEYRNHNLLGLPTSTRVRDGALNIVAETSISYDESSFPLLTYGSVSNWTDPGTTARGNMTTVGKWLNTSNSYLQTHTQYDQCGNVRYAWDVKGYQAGYKSEIEYSTTYQYAYPTHTISPAPDPVGVNGSNGALTADTTYDLNTGLVTSTTDANGKTTSFSYNDSLDRLTNVTRPTGGGSITYSYSDTPGDIYVRVQTALDASRSLDSYQYSDGLGRKVRSFGAYDGTKWSVMDTYYDSLGRVSKASNPYNVTTTSGNVPTCSSCTTTDYDDLSRVKKVTTPDGAQVITNYGGSTSGILGTSVTVTDQANKSRKGVIDALGRLVQVIEDPNGVAYQTSYSYDALDNLTDVTQGAQTRHFTYNSLRQLTSAKNPEICDSQGVMIPVTYDYDDNGNLWHKVDARGITTTYTYDRMNRVISRAYMNDPNQTPAVTYKYDGAGTTNGVANSKGRLTSVANSVSGTTYDEYDSVGRVKQSTQTTDGQAYSMSYSYDLAGNLISETYPSGRVVTSAYDAAGRLSSVTGPNNKVYADSIAYAPQGDVKQMRLGNNLWEHRLFNNRLQPTELGLGSSNTDSSKLKLNYSYGTTDNNGNVQSQTITLPTTNSTLTLTQTYSYDALNRLQTAQESDGTNQTWKQGYAYTDQNNSNGQYGNRRIDVSNTTSNVMPRYTPTFNASTNRIADGQGYIYDSAGNL